MHDSPHIVFPPHLATLQNKMGEHLEQWCRRWNVKRLDLFGSILRDDFDPEKSDMDFLVEFFTDSEPFGKARLHMIQELQAFTPYPVDLVYRSSVQESYNYIRRHRILSSSEPIYVAA